MTSLAVTPAASFPSTRTSKVSGLVLQQALGCQDVLDLAGADAESQRAKRTMGGGVAVAANDGHARLGQAQFRTDDVHHALVVAVQTEKADAVITAVLSICLICLRAQSSANAIRPLASPRCWTRGNAMVDSGKSAIRPADLQPPAAQSR